MPGTAADCDLTERALHPAVWRAAFPEATGGAAVILFRALLRAHGAPERLDADHAAELFAAVLLCPDSRPAQARAVQARVPAAFGGPISLRARYVADISAALQQEQLDELERWVSRYEIEIRPEA